MCILLITGLLLYWIGYDNLKKNSVYYAKQLPRGEGEEPELILLIENLEYVYLPDIDGIEYRMDGTNAIIDLKNNQKKFGNIYSNETEYRYVNSKEIYYRFNKHMELIFVMDKDYRYIDISTIDQEKLIEEIKDFTNPIIEAQREPFINLQFLFNWLHEEEFQ